MATRTSCAATRGFPHGGFPALFLALACGPAPSPPAAAAQGNPTQEAPTQEAPAPAAPASSAPAVASAPTGAPQRARASGPLSESPGLAKYEEAVELQRNGDWEAASRRLVEALDLDDGQPDFHLAFARLQRLRGDLGGARDFLHGGLELDPGRGDLWQLLGVVNYEIGDYEFAESSLVRASALIPDHVESHFYLGLLRYHMGAPVPGEPAADRDLVLAGIDSLQRALELRPNQPDAHFWLGVCFQSLGDHASALEHLQVAIAAQPRRTEAYLHSGASALASQDATLAERHYAQAVELESGPGGEPYGAYLGLARVREMQGDDSSAEALYRKAAKADKAAPEPHRALAELYRRAGRSEEAEATRKQADRLARKKQKEDLEAVRTPADRQAELLFATGVAFQEDQEWAKAQAEYERALKLRPDLVKAHVQLGEVLQMQGELHRALEHLRTAMKLDRGNPKARRLFKETKSLIQTLPIIEEPSTEDS